VGEGGSGGEQGRGRSSSGAGPGVDEQQGFVLG
jgi:hypothetical protein